MFVIYLQKLIKVFMGNVELSLIFLKWVARKIFDGYICVERSYI